MVKRRLRIGNATRTKTGFSVYLNIGSWKSMQTVREALSKWLPDLPVWQSANHWVEKSYFRNNFRWDGEYVLNLPLEAEKDILQIVRILQ